MAVGLEDPEKYQNSQGFCFFREFHFYTECFTFTSYIVQLKTAIIKDFLKILKPACCSITKVKVDTQVNPVIGS